MSPWWPESLHLEIAPDQVVVERRRARWSAGGIGWRPLARATLPIPGRPARGDWRAALSVLDRALADGGGGRLATTVVLANSLVRYLLVPASDHLGAERAAAVLEHCFRDSYGDGSHAWALCASPAAGHPLQLASGVPRELLDGLRGVVAGHGLRPVSIQPRLMAVCNRQRARIGRAPAWLALVEPGSLCLGLLADGELVQLRSLRPSGAIGETLAAMIERESCLADLEVLPQTVWWWSRDGGETPSPRLAGLTVRRLDDEAPGVAPAGPLLPVGG